MNATVAGVDDQRASRRNHQAPLGDHRYRLQFATTRREVEDALRLRFEVFNLELHEGFAESFFTGMDADEFDRVGEHLIITDEASGKVVGTYRMHTGDTAVRSGLGFYGARGSISYRMNPSAHR
jgi:putative hemolysin